MKRLVAILWLLFVPWAARAEEPDARLARDLAQIVRDSKESVWVRIEAAKSLGKLGPAAGEAVPELAVQMGRFRPNETPALQEAIARALGQIGHPAKAAIPALARAAGQSIDIDKAVSASISQIVVSSDQFDVPALVVLLRNRDETIRLRAVKALTRLGPYARAALPDLLISLSDIDSDVRHAAVTAFRAIGPNERLPDAIFRVYAADLLDPDESIRLRAAKFLGKFGPAAVNVLPALEAALDDPDKDVKRAVIDAMNRISPP